MKLRFRSKLLMIVFLCGMLASPNLVRAQQSAPQSDDGAFFLGSLLMSVLYLPIQLAACVGTQATAELYTRLNDFGHAGNLGKVMALVAGDPRGKA